MKPDGGNESHLGKLGILGMPWGLTGTVNASISMGEAPGCGLFHPSCIAAHWAILGVSAAFVFSWRVCEVLNASHNPDHERDSGICSSGYCLLLPCTVLGYRATVGHGSWVSCGRQYPEFLT